MTKGGLEVAAGLEAQIFYVGRGAAVAVRLGEPGCGLYGVIDCYQGNSKARGRLLRFLESKEVASVEFLVITHPHQDHFLGIKDLLKRCGSKIKHILDWGVDVRAVVGGFYSRDLPPDRRAAEELLSLHKYVMEERCKYTALTSSGIEFYRDAKREISASALAPRSRSFRLVAEALSRHVARCRKAARRGEMFPRLKGEPDPNLLSSAVLIESRMGQLLVGGDVLKGEWEKLLGDSAVEAGALILSHHGSHTGFPSGMWASRFGKAGSTGLVSGQGRHQPSQTVVRTITRAGGTVYSTSSPKREPIKSLLRDYVGEHHHGQEENIVSPQDLLVLLDRDGLTVESKPLL